MAQLACPPGLPALLEGFLNLRGEAVPVVRLRRLFGLPEQTPGLYTPVVILKEGGPLALLVDEVGGVLSAPEEDRLPVQEGHAFNDCVEAEVALEGRLVHLLSTDRLLLEGERRRIAEFQAVAQRRLREAEASGL
jgi:purine-binding chemotaxis protein CheW